MSTTDNKIKIQLRPTLPGSGPGIINRPDKNPSPSKLMINHGKPNYTINRTTNTLSPKNKPSTTETVTSPSLAFPLKPTNNPLSPVPSTASVGATSSTTNQIEKVILKHVPSTINVNSNSEPITYSNKPSVVSPVNSFVSPGISSKAAATSFGVKLKQCNNKKNIQNGDIPTTNGRDQNQSDEPEFVRRQKQIFEKLQLREQQQQQQQQQQHQVETNTITTKTEINSSNDSINNENNYQQNGHSNTLNNNSSIKQTNGYHSQEKTTTIIDSHVKNVTNRLENVSSTINSNINNSNMIDQQKSSSQQQNNSFKLPPGAICGKPAIPGKPANLQIPPSAARYQQQNNLLKNQNNSINSNNDLSTTVTSNTETTTTTTATTQKPITPTVNENNFVDNSIGANFEQKTIVSFSKDLSTEPNRYPDTVKITKTISNGNGINNSNDTINFNEDDVDDDDEGLKEFIAIEKTSKLAEEMAQIKFDIKTDEEDVTITPVVIR